MAHPPVEFEFERDGDAVVLSVRSVGCNFILAMNIDGATVFAASALRATDENVSAARFRFQLPRSKLEVSE
jgi:hypothetical protein